jgi:hypothetical protein
MLVSVAVNHANRPRPRIVAAAPTTRAVDVFSVSALKFPVANVFISQNESLSVRSLVFESCSRNHTRYVDSTTTSANAPNGTSGLASCPSNPDASPPMPRRRSARRISSITITAASTPPSSSSRPIHFSHASRSAATRCSGIGSFSAKSR